MFLSAPSDTTPGPLTPTPVQFEHHLDALGIGTARPRLSWITQTTREGWRQSGYEIATTDASGALLEQTGMIASDQSVLVPWPFAPLSSRQSRFVRVRVWGIDGDVSSWSPPAHVEVGLLSPDAWSARFIIPVGGDAGAGAPLLRRLFTVHSSIVQARLYITALGVYEAYLNGQVVGNQVLAPGWTSYDHRLRYQTFDVTEMLREDANTLGVMLGNGWYHGRLNGGSSGFRSIYGDRLAVLAQLEVTAADGTVERIVSDSLWQSTAGPILADDLYDGETYDARREVPLWASSGEALANWGGVEVLDRDLATLVAPDGPPVRRTEVVAPVAITTSPTGKTIVDFGQNLAGRVRLTVRGPAGHQITLRHAEILADGEIYTRSLGNAQATDRYLMRGDGIAETWEPRFTFHGFRYVEVENWPGDLHADDLSAMVCHSDLERTGWFTCSDPLINRLHENVIWGMRSNFLDIPTDCPQRSERLGWTGDIQVFAPTASFLYDTAGFLTSWLADLAVEQQHLGGTVPHVVPNTLPESYLSMAGWGDAAVVIPWVLYQRFGDQAILATQFDSMRAWVDGIYRQVGERLLWDRGYQYGDWLDPAAPPNRAEASRTDPAVVATAYFARSAAIVGQVAKLLDHQEEAAQYQALAQRIRQVFAATYLTPAGGILSDTETAYALALQFELLPEAEQRQFAGKRLAELVRKAGYHISTGFLGTPLICDALCAVGEETIAYRLLKQRECPSWLYPVTMGATTIWERWDSLLPDGSPNTASMVSFNHYAFGAVADWLHRTVAGLAPAAPGYRQISICPRPGGGLASASARHRTPYGLAEAAWAIVEGQITVRVTIPPNTSAMIALPGQTTTPLHVESGTYSWTYPFQAGTTLSLDSPLGAFRDDVDAWSMVLQAIIRAMPGFAGIDPAAIESGMRGYNEIPIRYVLGQMPQAEQVLAQLTGTLSARNSSPSATE